jgi:hypothetical protein
MCSFLPLLPTERGLPPLVAALAEDSEDHLRAATAWTLGQIGRHTSDHAKAVADTGGAPAVPAVSFASWFIADSMPCLPE